MTPADASGLLNIAVRTAVVLAWLVLGLRLLGKRQVGQMNIYDLALVMALANAVQNAMTSGKGDLSVGLVSAGVLLLGGRVLTAVFVRAPRLEETFLGTPTIVINDGHLLWENMQREHITEDQVLTALRQRGFTEPAEVKIAVLEVDGTLSVVPSDAPSSRTRRSFRTPHLP